MITRSSHSENAVNKPTGMEQEVRFRCPHCQKLYCTQTDVFDGGTPEFDCMGCEKGFVLSSKVDSFGLYETQKAAKYLFESCPKCSNLKPMSQDECPTCGVFASKYAEIQKNESPVIYELTQLWQKVVTNFEDDSAHQAFLSKCHQNMALNFAFQKYSEIQKTVGFDSDCANYIKQIELRLTEQFKVPEFNSTVPKIEQFLSGFGKLQISFMALGAFGMLLLIYNKFVPTFPNFNGLVLSFTIVCFGVGLFTVPRQKT